MGLIDAYGTNCSGDALSRRPWRTLPYAPAMEQPDEVDADGEPTAVDYEPDVDGEPTAVDYEPEEAPVPVCPTCGRPYGDGPGSTYTPGAGNIW